MGRIVLICLLLFQFLGCFKALFTVEITSIYYQAEYRGDVTMECRFPVGDGVSDLSIYWHRLLPKPQLDVHTLIKGQEDLNSQDPQYVDRVALNWENLRKGRATLQIFNLRINDSGTYQCLVEMGGADYKQATLAVQAPYRNVSVVALRECSWVPGPMELRCQAAGFPLAEVQWSSPAGVLSSVTANATSHTMSTDGLYVVTSLLSLNATCGENFTCSFVWEHETASASVSLSADKAVRGSQPSPRLRLLMTLGPLLGILLCVSGIVVSKKRGLWSLQGSTGDPAIKKKDEENEFQELTK